MNPAKARRTALIVLTLLLSASLGTQLTAESPAPGVSPIAQSKAAAKAGKATYLRLCQYCHGADGKALENIDFQATDLTDLTRWRHGTAAEEVFRSIKNGAGDDMPPFRDKLSDEQIWQLVSFIASIGPEERRPQQD